MVGFGNGFKLTRDILTAVALLVAIGMSFAVLQEKMANHITDMKIHPSDRDRLVFVQGEIDRSLGPIARDIEQIKIDIREIRQHQKRED